MSSKSTLEAQSNNLNIADTNNDDLKKNHNIINIAVDNETEAKPVREKPSLYD